MAQRRIRECKHRGCIKLTRSEHGYCEEHEREYLDKVNAAKKKWKIENNYKRPRNSKVEKFYSSKQWQQLREYIKARDNYLCQDCLKEGRITIANQVHHIEPILKAWDKRFDEDNLVSLCNEHHKLRHNPRCNYEYDSIGSSIQFKDLSISRDLDIMANGGDDYWKK